MFLSNLVVKEKTCLLVNPDEFETDPRKPFRPLPARSVTLVRDPLGSWSGLMLWAN